MSDDITVLIDGEPAPVQTYTPRHLAKLLVKLFAWLYAAALAAEFVWLTLGAAQ